MGPTDPIFIIGTERSGSNLLRMILTTHSRIDVPHPPHVLKYFAPLEPSYGPLSDPARLDALATDVLRLLAIHIHPWECAIDRARLVAEADPPDLFGLLIGLQEQHMTWAGKVRWGNKSTFMVDHVDRVLARFPDARFLWLVRDPRDVAVSSQQSVFSPFHPYFTACLWREQQERGLALEQRLGPAVLKRLPYESLLADPEAVVREICAFLGEQFEPEMLRYHESGAAKRGAGLSESWRNTAAPVIQANAGKWRGKLSEEELRAVEGVCREPMEALGYALDRMEPWTPPGSATLLRWRLENERGRLKVEWRSLRKDKNHWRRWGRALQMQSIGLRARLRR